MKKVSSKILALVMACAMLFSFAAPALAAGVSHSHEDIHYVSIGDSMTNGYGFEGYEQGTDDIDFFNGVGVYGEGSYALQFEEYLKQYGDVEHTKLAVSALRAEDLLYLLGGREMPTDGWFSQVLHYSNVYDVDALSAYYQAAVKDADIITLCIGNASFGAYMVQYITRALGVMGGSLPEEEVVTLDMALELLESEEAREIVLEIYATAMAELVNIVPAELAEKYDLVTLSNAIAYIAAGFLINYEGVIDAIVEANPDVEIMLIGLMNTTYGMEITADGMAPIEIGNIMDSLFGLLNAYIAGVPTAKQLAGEYEDAKFYYASQPQPKFIVQAFDDLAANNWENIDGGRLSGSIVRQRSIDAYNESLAGMIGTLVLGKALPAITLADVASYEFRPYTDNATDTYLVTDRFMAEIEALKGGADPSTLPMVAAYLTAYPGDYSFANASGWMAETYANELEKEISIVIYLAIEASVVSSIDTMEITLSGLLGIAGGGNAIFEALGAMPEILTQSPGPNHIYNALVDWFSSPTGQAMCKVYGLFKIGNGMSVHPTPAGHDDLFEVIVNAYESDYTAQDETLKNLGMLADLIKDYYDEAYEIAYDEAVKAGVIAMINAYLDEAVNSVNLAKAWVLQYPEYIKSAEFATALSNTFANAEATIEEARDLINNADKIDAETFAKASELLAALTTNANDLNELVAIAIVDATPYVLELEAQAQAQIDALKAQAEYQLLVLNEQLKTAVGEAKAAILAEIARVEAELAAAIEAVKADLAAAIADAEAKFEAAVATLKAAIVALKGNVTATADEIAAIIADVDAKIGGLIKAVYAFFNGGYTETDTYKMIAAIINAIKNYIAGIVTGELELTENTFYLAIVDGDDGYADIIADALNLGADQYKKVTFAEVTAADIARADLITVAYNGASAIDYAVMQAIGFAGEYLDGALRDDLNAYVANAFTGILAPAGIQKISAALNGAIDGVLATYVAGGVEDLNWAALVGEENLTYVENAKTTVNNALVEAGVPGVYTYTVDVVELLYANADALGMTDMVEMFEMSWLYGQLGENAYYTVEIPVMDVIALAVESAAYAYTAYNLNYYKTMLTINAVNPDASVAALGNYSRFDVDYDVVIDEVAFTLADVLAELGCTDVAMPTEIITALGALANVESVTIFTNIVEMTNIALGEYNKAIDYVVTLDLPVCDEAKAMVADLITAANTYVGEFAGKVVEAEYITVDIPGAAIAALIINQGKLIEDMVDASINTVITVGGQTVNANDVLDIVANITSMYPFAFALEFDNVFFVAIPDAKVGGDAYVAAKVLGALTVKCNHTYTDCEDAICNICGDERVPVGHSFTNYTSNNDATCTENGTKTATCDNGCGVTNTVVDENTALGHAYDNGVVTTAPTCEGAGVKTFTCANCGDTYTEAVSATGHTVVIDEAVAPTCTETGLTAGSHCSVCDAVIEAQEVVPATGHDYNDGVITTAPTCEGAGVKTFTCANCGDTYTEAVSAKGHTEVTVPGKAATCTETGLTDGKKCSVCNAVIVAQTTIAKKAHTEVTVPGKAATCTETGLTDGKKCSVCNTVTVAQTTIAKKAHTEVTTPGTAATCTATGLTDGKKCSVCNTVTVAQTTIAALGHTEVTIPGTAATCTDTGLTDGKKCSVCDTVTVEQTTIAALGHTYDNGVVTTAPTYTAEGVKTFTCSVCGDTYTEAVAKLPTADEITSTGGIKVNVPAGSTAILDPNTVINVNAITEAISKDVKNNIKNAIGKGKTTVLASYDISLLLDGATVQPGGMIAFTLPAPEDTDYDSFVVVFIDDDGNVTPCETTVNEDGSVTFLTDHFSQYSIVGVNNGSNAWIWISAIAAVLVAGAVVAFIVIKKKRNA